MLPLRLSVRISKNLQHSRSISRAIKQFAKPCNVAALLAVSREGELRLHAVSMLFQAKSDQPDQVVLFQ